MRSSILKAVVVLTVCLVPTVVSFEDTYFFNYFNHPYQTYYLEDYCGPTENTDCHAPENTIHLNSSGSGSALIVRGFRDRKPNVQSSVKCCITVKTYDWDHFNVQLDEIYMKQQQIGKRCENFVRFHGLGEELGHICNKIKEFSFTTPRNEMEIEYVLNAESVPDFQKIKVVVTASANATTLDGGKCDATKEQWQCNNNGCIWEGFRCDAQNNCGDWSDEFYCGFFYRHAELVIGLSTGVIIFFIVCCCCCCCCKRRRKVQLQQNKGFQFVSSLGPDSKPLQHPAHNVLQSPQNHQSIYPQLHVPYQGATPAHPSAPGAPGAPPAYSESAYLTPSYNPGYGSTSKS